MIIAHTGREYPESFEEIERINNYYSEESIKQMMDGTYEKTPRKNRTYPESDIYMPEYLLYEDEYYTDIFGDKFICRELAELERISSGLVTADGKLQSKYILDIDLDYFLVPEAAGPKRYDLIGRLIKNAEVITIAKESNCVELCSGGKCNSKDLPVKVLQLINEA